MAGGDIQDKARRLQGNQDDGRAGEAGEESYREPIYH